jgi:uridine kinase
MPAQTMSYPALARRLRALPPSCGPVRVVAVDGPSGAGKSTFAGRLAAALSGAPVVASDDFPVPWDGDPLAWWPPVAEHVLAPLAAGRAGGYRPYDWHRGTYLDRVEVPVTPVLIVEGVGAAWREAPAAYRIWVDAPADVRRARAIERDGQDVAPAWDRWRARERAHFTADRTPARADLHVDGAPAIPLDLSREFAPLPVRPR